MSTVDVSAAGINLPEWEKRCRIFVTKVLEAIGEEDQEVSIVLCSNEFIRNLNNVYRGKDEPTDVLSFAQADEESPGDAAAKTAGDVVISLEAAAENARRFDVKLDEEIRRLLIHGVLHLLGWDHSDNAPDQEMLVFQEKILGDLRGERLL